MSATVTSTGQITIPKRVRDLAGIEPGSRVEFERGPDGSVVLIKVGKKGRACLPRNARRCRGYFPKVVLIAPPD